MFTHVLLVLMIQQAVSKTLDCIPIGQTKTGYPSIVDDKDGYIGMKCCSSSAAKNVAEQRVSCRRVTIGATLPAQRTIAKKWLMMTTANATLPLTGLAKPKQDSLILRMAMPP